MVILTAQDLCMAFGVNTILDNAAVTINAGERIGVVGKNGAGKSTLLKILAEDIRPDGGNISKRRGLSAHYVSQECVLDLDKTVLQNIQDGAAHIYDMMTQYENGEGDIHELEHLLTQNNGWDIDNTIKIAMQELNTAPEDKLCSQLSGGEQRRVAICKAIVSCPDLLILDEPTNHLDTQSIEWLETYLKSYGGTSLFVTHDRYFLDNVATRVIEVEQGQIYTYEGNYTAYLEGRAKRVADLELNESKRKSYIRREIDWIRRGPKARGTKAKYRVQKFDEMVNSKTFTPDESVELIIPPPQKLGNIILEINDLGMTRGGKKLFDGMNFTFERGTCLGIVGHNGTGKSTLLKLILDELEAESGSIKVGQNTVFNYIDQNRFLLDESKTVMDEAADGKDHVMLGEFKVSVWTYLKRFLFTDDRIRQEINLLSGGEKNRLLLAKMIKYGGNFLILDEPTNDLDLPTLRVLEEALEWFMGCSIVVSHDRYFLNRICTHILSFDGSGEHEILEGDYDYYLEKCKQKEKEAKVADKQEKEAVTTKKKTGMSWSEKKEFETIEDDILVAEEAVEEIEAKMAAPDFYEKHGDQMEEITKDLKDAKKVAAQLFERWEYLSENEG